MSVTFHLEGASFEDENELEMNLSNSNARALLSALGFVEQAEDLCGYLNPDATLRALAVLTSNPAGLIKPPSDNGGVHIDENGVRPVCRILDGGRSHDQVSRYIANLSLIAQAAINKGVRISFG